MFVVFWDRQQPEKIDVAMNDFLRGGVLDFGPWQRLPHGVLEPRQQIVGGHADRIRDPASIGKEVGDHRQWRDRPAAETSRRAQVRASWTPPPVRRSARCRFAATASRPVAASAAASFADRDDALWPRHGRRQLHALHLRSSRLMPIRSGVFCSPDGVANSSCSPQRLTPRRRRYRTGRARGRRYDRPYLRAYPAWHRRREPAAR